MTRTFEKTNWALFGTMAFVLFAALMIAPDAFGTPFDRIDRVTPNADMLDLR